MKKILSVFLVLVTAVTLVACTKEKVVTVNFNSQGGTPAEYPAQTVNNGSKLTRVARPTKEGFDFVGWHKNEKGSGAAFNFAVDTVKKSSTLFAKWGTEVTTTDTVTVTFVVPTDATEIASIKTTKGKLLASEPQQPALKEHDFAGWYKDAKFKKAFNIDGDLVTEDITLYAKFDKKAINNNAGTYRATISTVTNLNHYSETLNTASALNDYLTGNLYETDIDWTKAIADGQATAVGQIKAGVKSSDLPFGRFPLFAESEPTDVSSETGDLVGTVWEIKVKSGLKFEDNTPITAQTWVDSWKLLLDPKLKNARANLIYDANQYLGLLNARAYYEGSETDFSKVGISVKDGNTLVLKLTAKKDVWDVKGLLEGGSTGIVHVENYKKGLTADGTRTTYGTRVNPLVSSGPYKIETWEAEKLFIFSKNDNFVNSSSYKVQKVRYDVINNQTAEINEFKAGNIDSASVSGQYFLQYEKDPRLKQAPTTATFRMAFNYVDTKDATGEVTRVANKFLKNKDLRQAIYLATDRKTLAEGIRKPSIAQPGFLSNQYYATEQNLFPYRNSAAGLDAYTALTDKPNGFDPEKALSLFNKALQSFNNEAIKIEVTFFDSETNHQLVEWLNDTMKTVFQAQAGQANAGKFELTKKPLSSDAIDKAWDEKTYDITMGGWQGVNFNPLSLLGQVFNSHPTYVANATEHLTDTETKELTVKIPNAKAALPGWIEEVVTAEKVALLTTDIRTDLVQKYETYYTASDAVSRAGGKPTEEQTNAVKAATAAIKKVFVDAGVFEETVADNRVVLVASWINLDSKIATDGTFTSTFHRLFLTAYTELSYEQYEGKDEDFNVLTGAVEKMLIEEVIASPLTSSVSNVVYSERVQFLFDSYHARLGWGGIKYMSIVD